MSRYYDQLELGIDVGRCASALVTALKQLGWREPFVNNEMQTISAQLQKEENVRGEIWNYHFLFRASWAKKESGSFIEVDLSELNFDWTESGCQKQFFRLKEALDRDLSRQPEAAMDGSGARWSTECELQSAGYLSEAGKGLIVGRVGSDLVQLTDEDTVKHALVCGPTGSGKTSGVFVPNLIERVGTSAIVTEATGGKGIAHLYKRTSGYRFAHGHKIFYFNPDDLKSHRINPLGFVKTYGQAMRVVEIIMQSTTMSTHKGDQSWEMSEKLLLTSLILHASGSAKHCTLGSVRDLLFQGQEKISGILADSPVIEAEASYRGFLKNSTEAYRNLVAQGLVTRLSLWGDPRIRALTEANDIDLLNLQGELFTMYLGVPAGKPELKPLASLIFNLLFDVVTQQRFEFPMALFLDEFANFGYVRGMPQKLTILRHDNIPAVLGIQDYVQLELVYGKEALLFLSQPGTRVFFRPNDLRTAEGISRALGMAEQKETTVASSGQFHEAKERKYLLPPEELLALEPSDLIAFLPKTRPTKLGVISWQSYKDATDGETYQLPEPRSIDVNEELKKREVETFHRLVEELCKQPVEIDRGGEGPRELAGGFEC
ncbi:MAG: type IV secretory system conjugative DNA transfer family protein [Candidatus Obscuribacterales bacterium]|nr:type IV secretory system conjugative DNA transfer family protein [Candidatus Obscuribacterales bacterium]